MNEYVCYEGENLRLFNMLDKKFLSFLEGYEYENYHIPGMISENSLKKCGYIDSFPQQLSVLAHVKNTEIEKVLSSGEILDQNIQIEKMYMSPSACLHFYPLLENQIINEKIMTTLTQVYRYEDGKFNSKSRLWEFNVREIVFVGNSHYVSQMLDMMVQKALRFAQELDSKAYIKEANDLFYPSRRNELKGLIQKKNKLKRELIMHIGKKEVAVASFNSHSNHFSKPFKFDGDGSTVSGCVGFGMERWISVCEDIDDVLKTVSIAQ